MGRKSTKENKSIFQIKREACGLTREKAAELLEFISDDRIEKIESDKLMARPEEVLKMAEVYKSPDLNNYYCSHICPIGQKYIPEVESKDLSKITLEILDGLNNLDKLKNRLIEITVDGTIDDNEKKDFEIIKNHLQEMSDTIESLKLWLEKTEI